MSLSTKQILDIEERKQHPECGQITESFPISRVHTVVFREFNFSGMVGEQITSFDAFLVKVDPTDPEITKLDYQEVRRLYRYTEGKDDRIAYWNYMNEMSPEARANRSEAETQQALSRVR